MYSAPYLCLPPGVVSDSVCTDLFWKRREKAKLTIATSKPLGFVILNLCVFQASAAENRVQVSQQRSLLSSLFTLCFAMFLTKFIFEILASLAKVARTALLCMGFCIMSCVRAFCRKPATILCGVCLSCFAYSLHVIGCLDHVLSICCGLVQIVTTCPVVMYQQVEANLCIHPWCSGALFLASAGSLIRGNHQIHLQTQCVPKTCHYMS